MLYTRCPECDTVFRITEAALQQAEGQVRCGRCACIFNAHDALTDRLEESGEGREGGETTAGESAVGQSAGRDAPDGAQTTDAATEQPDDDAGGSTGASSRLVDIAEAPDSPQPEAPDWLDDGATTRPRRHRAWLAAAVVAVAVLAAQLVHHYRFRLIDNPVAGPLLERVYASVGSTIEPEWNVDEYELLDWIAVADPAAAGHGTLIIRSRLLNTADRPQPYPMIWLRLLDRWEAAVAARLFTPEEYLAAGPESDMMTPGVPVDMELTLVDPGTEAYGFELAICTGAHDRVRCDTDATFGN